MDQAKEEIFEVPENEIPQPDAPVNVVTAETPNIETKNIIAAEAFQYFHGKVYAAAAGPRSEYSLVDSIEKRVESPFQKYSRLRAEVEELQNDLKSINEEREESEGGVSMWTTLQRETAHLVHSLEEMNSDVSSAQDTYSRQADRVAEMMNSLSLGNDATQETNLSSDGKTTDAVNTKRPVDGSALASLERRVYALEAILGSASSSLDMEGVLGVPAKSRCHSLVENVTRLERRIQFLDESGIDNVKAKVAQLRTELEEVQRDKIRTGGLAHKAIEAAQKVETLNNKVTEVQAIAEDLPALLLRLKTLETIHREAATFNVRLSSLDSTASNLHAELSANSDLLKTLKEGFAENVALMRDNVQQLDERINALSNK